MQIYYYITIKFKIIIIKVSINLAKKHRVFSCLCRPITPVILDQNYIQLKNQVIKAERRVLKELGFCVHIKHPHKVSFYIKSCLVLLLLLLTLAYVNRVIFLMLIYFVFYLSNFLFIYVFFSVCFLDNCDVLASVRLRTECKFNAILLELYERFIKNGRIC